jgi:microcystin-dependent protein
MDGTMANITLFAADFAPRNWALCNGAILSISTNQALFSLLGTIYGGNGIQTFALPDLRGRAAMGTGNAPGMGQVALGTVGGTETNTMSLGQLPAHTHAVMPQVTMPVNNTADPDADSPEGAVYGKAPQNMYNSAASAGTNMGPLSIQSSMSMAGNSQAINNMMPSLAMNYVICIAGIYPSRD